MSVIRRDGSRGSGAPYREWSVEKGVGYCLSRSRQHGKRLGHLFVCRATIVEAEGRESNLSGRHPSLEANSQPGETLRCAWCWKASH